MTFDSYYNLEINLPSLETQQKIAKILSDLDDKIEVLNQLNDNLAQCHKKRDQYFGLFFILLLPVYS